MTDRLDQIRSGKAQLVAQRTARIRFDIQMAAFGETIESHHEGIVDFEHGRYHWTGDEEEHIGAGGIGFTRSQGEDRWKVIGEDQAAPPAAGDLLWMLDLLAGVTSAEELASPAPERVRYACKLDLLKADEESSAGVSMPGGYTVRQLRQLELEVALDDEGIVREIAWTLPDGNSARVELVQLGVAAAPIELPTTEQTVRFEDLLEEDEED
jgi:hypothetical protein